MIANEHLTEALRRLRKTSSAENVDRRLVTNILLQYLSTARGDGKRFEMLSLLASILSWSDTERESAGLQRITTSSLVPPGRSVSSSTPVTPIKTEESEVRPPLFPLIKISNFAYHLVVLEDVG